MKTLAVRFYRDKPDAPEAKAGVPGDWPADVVEQEEGSPLPDGPGWRRMSVDEYHAHRASLSAQREAWQKTQDDLIAAKLAERRDRHEKLMADLTAAEAAWDTLTRAQRDQVTQRHTRLLLALAARLDALRPLEAEEAT